MTEEDSQTGAEKVVLASFDLLEVTSESTRAKTAGEPHFHVNESKARG